MHDDWGWRPYVSAAERRLEALREMGKRRKKGLIVSPVTIEGRTIVKTFWGKSWCENLERYSDFANRLPRGRTYVRNGSVIDLQISSGEIKALVSGSEIYEVAVQVTPVAKTRWRAICKDCAGAIDSLIELLQGRLSKGVMEAEHLAEAEWPRTASTARGERSRLHLPWLSATGSFPRRAERGAAATAGDPCWPRPHTRAEPAPGEDVGPWRGPTVEWHKSREKRTGPPRPYGSRRG